MAKSNAVWGIDIGQCALKALRCTPHEDSDKVTADAFDFIEYPKILSQPEADPVELVRDAIAQFLSRNKVKDDRIAISVPGQAGLARFIKLPPVESKKIPDIVRYEARQQIPFALEDVVWDYQQMAGGSEEDGFALETEVGLFAMKREQVFKALRPFSEAGIEVDFIQLAPLTLYNFVVFDQMPDLKPLNSEGKDQGPESTVVISLGTDTTDLVITNGYRVWQRNIPLGGSHFTRALTKELKLTFTKAEHLKRNALKAEDPKAVFLAMRPVFNDLVTEVQRSISFFQSVDRNAKIKRVVPLGNAMKLRGLQKYLGQSLGYEVVELSEYRGLRGQGVVNAPSFKENMLSFGVCYGLALQGLKRSTLRTNLIPPEIVQDRRIRAKKPWAVAAVAALLLGCSLGFVGHWRAWASAPEADIKEAVAKASGASGAAAKYKADFDKAKTDFAAVRETGDRLLAVSERRTLWPELIKAIGECVPQDPPGVVINATNAKLADIRQRVVLSKRIYLDSIDCEHFSKLEDWYADASVSAGLAPAAGAPPTDAAPAPGSPAAGAAAASGPTGEGWVVQIRGHHYHNEADVGNEGSNYVRKTLLKNLEDSIVEIPSTDGKSKIKVPIKQLGVSYALLLKPTKPYEEEIPIPGIRDEEAPKVKPNVGRDGGPGAKERDQAKISVLRFDFTLQFAWKESPYSSRQEKPKGPEGEKPPALAGPVQAPKTN